MSLLPCNARRVPADICHRGTPNFRKARFPPYFVHEYSFYNTFETCDLDTFCNASNSEIQQTWDLSNTFVFSWTSCDSYSEFVFFSHRLQFKLSYIIVLFSRKLDSCWTKSNLTWSLWEKPQCMCETWETLEPYTTSPRVIFPISYLISQVELWPCRTLHCEPR